MTKPVQGCFIARRKDGLGARLLVSLTSIRLARTFGADYRIHWTPEGSLAPFIDDLDLLFSREYQAARFLDIAAYDSLEDTFVPISDLLEARDPYEITQLLRSGKNIVVDEGFEIITFAWEDPAIVRTSYRALIHELEFSDYVKTKIAEIDAEIAKGGDLTAYHLRRGDILNVDPWMHTVWPSKIEPDEFYDAHVAATKGAPSAVFSDTQGALDRFMERNPSAKTIANFTDLSDASRAQRDFCELYLMSRASRIVAPVISAFSSAAARISGMQRLRFVDVLDVEQQESAWAAVEARLLDPASEYVSVSEKAHIASKLHRRLIAMERPEVAAKVSQGLMDEGAENAFVPVMHAVESTHTQNWSSVVRAAEIAIDHPNIWPDDFVVALAMRGHAHARLGEDDAACHYLMRAFCLRPLNPDTRLVAGRLIFDDALPLGALPDFDAGIMEVLRAKMTPRFQHCFLDQFQIFRHRRLIPDLRILLPDWHGLSTDKKGEKTAADKALAKGWLAKLKEPHKSPPAPAETASFEAVCHMMLGDPNAADSSLSRAESLRKDAALDLKRRSALAALQGDIKTAISYAEKAHDAANGAACYGLALAELYLQSGALDDARASADAAFKQPSGANIGMMRSLARACLDKGDAKTAKAYLDQALAIGHPIKSLRNFAANLEKRLS